ncbi:ATP-dependent DNA helicase yku80 [Exophiala dermatitidis]|uniref:ATP-dependent DNA helicase II subunit 2 n=2 Tax=Exophiala dermatitidis TaxID=5970 RepID=H6BXJ3_EXODN|nr:ATP-dependent DNA helicase 2 subunit 2 [Exophiala dermatitidis NIH/UT8656]KAJ4503939.1 ATP-dependent DNA helicase yku80 [Exophiala dermatitidis]EHY56240.1 ATP-dependent DNA helicase 2 subunit 2 [Exophiala dermatitidis NIH/UT8656]KAJ4505294.1 ATP-dependent DNA helicase yku80 [Exophiala dermatitidis]KAJ4505753.1 ATP-dependent DNA helicase yku80 [Exophiala dermatitidis]KAJ4536314.1 ATP-dependent DNA helicase yku80 [Exophiala dermatitidis]
MDKEATVYVIDLAKSMGEKHSGREISDLDWALQYVWDKITNTVFTGRKTLQIGVVGLGTDETSNDMMDQDDSYRNISVLQRISQILMPELQALPELLRPSHTDDRDVVSGIIIAGDMIMKHCKNLKYKKRIVVITNANGYIDDDDIGNTAEHFKNHGIELVILGIDFDDPEYGFKEEGKPPQKMHNEQTLQKLADLSGGIVGTMQEAIDELSRPHIKPVRPTPTYKGLLKLGDPENYDTALCIDVERYFKTSIKRPPTASAYAVRPEDPSDENLSTVHNLYKYKVKDEESGGGTRDVDREELAKGFEYGRTAVAISESEQNITKLETYSGYDILGFIPVDNVERYMMLDNSSMIVAQKGNDKAAIALSSLVHALYEVRSVAVGRLVKKDMTEPIITLLSPFAEQDFECLIENILPFAEDVRTYRFPPLHRVLTVSGKEITEHRNLPTADLLQGMSDFVDSMSLVHKDDEEMSIDDTFSPVLHTIEGAIKHRAVHPKDPLPEKSEMFLSYSRQPEHLQAKSKHALAKLIAAADVKKVPPRTKGRRKYRDTEKPLSGLNVEDLFRKEERNQISPNNAIPEFKQMIEYSTDMDVAKDAVKQMGSIMEDWISKSFGDVNYDRVLEGLSVVREEVVGLEEPGLYNDLLRGLKKKLVSGKLGGNRTDLWYRIRVSKLGLITDDVSPSSDVNRADADTFMSLKE